MMPMSPAHAQLIKQVHRLFQAYPHQKSVVLVAITGFWWSYMIYHHDHTNGIPVDIDDDENTGLPDEECGGNAMWLEE